MIQMIRRHCVCGAEFEIHTDTVMDHKHQESIDAMNDWIKNHLCPAADWGYPYINTEKNGGYHEQHIRQG